MDLGDLHRFQGVVVPSCGTSLQNSARPEAIVSGRPPLLATETSVKNLQK
jgi:hypothetical protein